MRFLLDADVALPVATLLRGRGHEVWTVDGVGLGDATDEVVVAFAHLNDATVVTHDRRMADRQRRRAHGRMLLLRAARPSGSTRFADLAADLPELERRLGRRGADDATGVVVSG